MAKILNIITDPDPNLKKPSRNVDLDSIKDIQGFLENLKETMEKKDGLGLAAPQVGERIRVIVVKEGSGAIFMINPEITKKSWAKEWSEEGCLSVPDYYGQVQRHKKITCSYLDEKGNKKKVHSQGLGARVIQHEIDHLDGILFKDKAKDLKKSGE